jgi:glucose/arabinose dehydrogenase
MTVVLGAHHLGRGQASLEADDFAPVLEEWLTLDDEAPLDVRLESLVAALDARVYRIPIEDDPWPSGPFEVLSDSRFLFIGRCGELVYADIGDGRAATLEKLVASHLDEAPVAAGRRAPERVHCEGNAGIKGSALRDDRLYLALHVRGESAPGLHIVVREYRLGDNELQYERELFRSFPPIEGEVSEEFSGGRLALVGDRRLALALGDFDRPEMVQRDDTAMGKVFMIDLAGDGAREYTRGHRSPSGGLVFDAATGQLWLSEHGPRGGDEINLLEPGANYGWPVVSYGMPYPNDPQRYARYAHRWQQHEGFEKPKTSFVPSIGLGPVAVYPHDGPVAAWAGHLLLAGMASNTLYRAHREGDSIAYVEPLLAGYRIRDMRIDSQGTLFLKTDDQRFIRTEGTALR